jgi:hypothetical protein
MHIHYMTLCPCCQNIELPLGLFAKSPEPAVPASISRMLQLGDLKASTVSEELRDGCVEWGGRAFMRAETGLPPVWLDSPIKLNIWVEIPRRYLKRDTDWVAEGILAEDVPGFPGSIGSVTTVEYTDGNALVRMIEDERIVALGNHPSHDKMARLYRAVWGNFDDVIGAEFPLRRRLAEAWRERIGRPTYRSPATPPPGLAGIEAAEIIIAPPLDTGGEVLLGTIGCAEALSPAYTKTELFTSACDPNPEFIKSFAEFCYLSRINERAFQHGTIIPEREKIMGTEDMNAWLLMNPSWLDENIEDMLDEDVIILSAVPLHYEEMQYAHDRGPGKLVEELQESGANFADLDRNPVV